MKADVRKNIIDVDLIDEAIEKYMSFTNSYTDDIYIIMNYKTFYALADMFKPANPNDTRNFIYNYIYTERLFDENKNKTKIFHGCRIAIDDGLEFGEIDIR